MATFEAYEHQPIPEVDIRDHSAVEDHLIGLYNLELAGFILRQADLTLVEDKPLNLGFTPQRVTLSECLATAEPRDPSKNFDCGLHLDEDRQLTPTTKITNFHKTRRGPAELQLVAARADAPTDALPQFYLRTARDLAHTTKFAQGQVDTELFVPVCYTEILYDTDVAVLLDWRTAHKFRTLAPRSYLSGLVDLGLVA